MKVLFFSLFMATSAFAQNPTAYLQAFDAKVYSLKTKGIKDFVVDIESSKLTKQINDLQTFGNVEELIFRTYWTAQPERLAIEVIGLPEGFKEVKEELKISMLQLIDNLLPQTMEKRFQGYQFTQVKPREYIAKDTSGLAPIPSFTLKFDDQDKLTEVVGNKPIGTFVVTPVYTKPGFADGKLVLTSQTSTSSEAGQTLVVTKELDYDKAQGITVLSEVTITTAHQPAGKDTKGVKVSDTVEFKNYKIDEGAAFKYFLGEAKPAAAPDAPKK